VATIPETNAQAPHAIYAADASGDFRTEQPGMSGLVRDAAQRHQPQIDRRWRVLALFEVNPVTKHQVVS